MIATLPASDRAVYHSYMEIGDPTGPIDGIEPAAAPVPSDLVAEPSVARAALSWLRHLTLSVVIAIVIILFLYQPVKVEGTSMMPSLVNEERIFINKFVYRFADIERGDTVVFQFPNDISKSYIKRVIGMPGDTVAHRPRPGDRQRKSAGGALRPAGESRRHQLHCNQSGAG